MVDLKNALSGNGLSSRIKQFPSRIFCKLHVYLSRNQCWATTPLLKIHLAPAKKHIIISPIASSEPCIHASSITESPSQDRLWLISFLLQGLLGRSLQKCTLTFAQSFAKLSRNFRENTPIRRPLPSAGGASEQSLTFGSLAAAFGARFLRLQKATL